MASRPLRSAKGALIHQRHQSTPSRELLPSMTLSHYMPLRVTLFNLFTELSHHPPTVQDNSKQKVTGADLYATTITLRQLLTGKVSTKIHALLQSVVRVAQVSFISNYSAPTSTTYPTMHLFNSR